MRVPFREECSVSAASTSRPYVTITADSHAGASLDVYRGYLDPSYRDDFDAWRAALRPPTPTPKDKHADKPRGRKTKNWDTAERFADQEADGTCAEVIFLNT